SMQKVAEKASKKLGLGVGDALSSQLQIDSLRALRGYTANSAIGFDRMVYQAIQGTGSSSSVTNNTVNMQGLFDGANFNVRNEQDISKLAKELGDYIKMSARKN